MVSHRALLPLLLVVSASAQGATTKSSSTCGTGDGCQERPDAKEHVLLQAHGTKMTLKVAPHGAAVGKASARQNATLARANSYRARADAFAKARAKAVEAKASRQAKAKDGFECRAVCVDEKVGCDCPGEQSCADTVYGYGWCDGGWGCPKCEYSTHLECEMPDGKVECKTYSEGCPCDDDVEEKCTDPWGWSWCQPNAWGPCPTWEPPCQEPQIECWDHVTWEVGCYDECPCGEGEASCNDGHGYGWCSLGECPAVCDWPTEQYCWDKDTYVTFCNPAGDRCPGHPCGFKDIECWECGDFSPEPTPSLGPA